MNLIYQNGVYVIYRVDNGYILRNVSMDGFAHTHIKSFVCCIDLIKLSLKKKLPHHLSKYLLISLLRINDDEAYVQKINELLTAKNNKTNAYYNVKNYYK